MLEQPQIMRLAQAMAQHAVARQALIAQNMANADTPGYRARDVAPYRAALGDGGDPMRQTRRAHHSSWAGSGAAQPIFDMSAEAAPNGNTPWNAKWCAPPKRGRSTIAPWPFTRPVWT
ncbi:MAG: flagellar basal body protein [Pseudomonadota bacterium]